ncbi:MAG: pyridoxal 5'-phosphate synthase glutaminase subunit PdxT [Armatimonadetes bacterium]|nr:pyridoxal 5'-phosphate synthase glutaminase subunit PdxT [Armatimonadota bacterium]
MVKKKIGILALQGGVIEHLKALEKCKVKTICITKKEELYNLQGLIIPGGESTTISKLMQSHNLWESILDLAEENISIWGTCAGLILLSKKIKEKNNPSTLGLMDIEVARNAFGRQRESFESDLSIKVLGEKTFPGVFIRAPYILTSGSSVEILASFENKIVAVRQGRFLGSAFHPELTKDLRFHKYFLKIVSGEI